MIGDYAEIDVFERKFEGRIVDETKNMFVLRVDSRRVMLPKEVSVIRVKEKEGIISLPVGRHPFKRKKCQLKATSPG